MGNDEYPYKGIACYPYMGIGAYPCMGKFKQSIYGLPLSCCFNVIHSVIYRCFGLEFVCHVCYSFILTTLDFEYYPLFCSSHLNLKHCQTLITVRVHMRNNFVDSINFFICVN